MHYRYSASCNKNNIYTDRCHICYKNCPVNTMISFTLMFHLNLSLNICHISCLLISTPIASNDVFCTHAMGGGIFYNQDTCNKQNAIHLMNHSANPTLRNYDKCQ